MATGIALLLCSTRFEKQEPHNYNPNTSIKEYFVKVGDTTYIACQSVILKPEAGGTVRKISRQLPVFAIQNVQLKISF